MISWTQEQKSPFGIYMGNHNHGVALIRNKKGRVFFIDHDTITNLSKESLENSVKIIKDAIAQKEFFIIELISKNRVHGKTDMNDFLMSSKNDLVN